MDDCNTGKAAILRFWRDVEIFNIPKAPKRTRDKNQRGELRAQTMTYHTGQALPWQAAHLPILKSNQNEAWIHAVFLGVTAAKEWAQVVLQVVRPDEKLNESDLQRLGGDGWLVALMVNSAGQIIADSCVPASFALGVQRLVKGQTPDGLSAEIALLVEAFASRHTSTITADAPPAQVSQELPAVPPMPSPQPENSAPINTQCGWSELEAELQQALKMFAPHLSGLSFSVVIKSSLRKIRKDNDQGKPETDIDFLNSFFLSDLDRLIGQAEKQHPLGAALTQYLGPAFAPQARRDILTQPDAMAESLSPAKLALGRWPANSKHHLMLAQQAAVGEIISQLHAGAGLVAVNGPPGTGKTTLLCDVVADVVVRRAQALAKLSEPWQAFGAKTIIGGMNVYPLKPEIVAGTGIVVSSNNNAAVGNITKELPAQNKIEAEEYPNAAYFQEVAANVFATAKIAEPAWGLVAAALGNSTNNNKFADAFFSQSQTARFEAGKPCDMHTRLKAADGADLAQKAQWHQARTVFLQILAQVEAQRDLFETVAQAVLALQPLHKLITQTHQEAEAVREGLILAQEKWAQALVRANNAKQQAQQDVEQSERTAHQARLAAQAAEDRFQVAQTERVPRIWDRCLHSLGYVTTRMREWLAATSAQRLTRANASDSLRLAVLHRDHCVDAHEECKKKLAEIVQQQQHQTATMNATLNSLKQQLQDTLSRHKHHEQQIADFKRHGGTVPDAAFFAQPASDRHLASAWVSAEFDALRARLFLAGLRLHETTLLSCNYKAICNFKAAMAMLKRTTPEPIAKEHRALLWDSLFFAVPVISTSLASFGRLFVDLEGESLGWLLIDEAGQATPQSVAGAIWRSKRAVIIGDPLQVEPVMTVPTAIVAQLRSNRGVDACYSPALASAQTVADRTMRLGAYIGDAESETAVWTGLPLRAHRRCIDPMFAVANKIAYADQMVQANRKPDAIDCIWGDSAWLDVRGQTSDGQVVDEEMRCLRDFLVRLKTTWPTHGKAKQSGLYIISPFKKVADACRSVCGDLGLKKPDWPVDCGTVHSFQGKEAEIVVIVLGSAPGKAGSGSRTWASSKPNILNVALTRAKLRVFVIGNTADWAHCAQFDVLLQTFRSQGRILDVGHSG